MTHASTVNPGIILVPPRPAGHPPPPAVADLVERAQVRYQTLLAKRLEHHQCRPGRSPTTAYSVLPLFHYGVLSLAGYLQSHGIQPQVVWGTTEVGLREKLLTAISRTTGPLLLGFGSVTPSWPAIGRLTVPTREHLGDLLVVCGGPHPTYSPDSSLRETGIDGAIRFAGEDPAAPPVLYVHRTGSCRSPPAPGQCECRHELPRRRATPGS